MSISPDPQLGAQGDELPPEALLIDGVLRGRNRDITVDEALRFSARGLRAFVIGWKFGSEVSTDRLTELLATHAGRYVQHGPHPPEASVHIYGHRGAAEDPRIVVARIGDVSFDQE